jgi:hypothetical protein
MASEFDSDQMTHDHRVPERDRLLIARRHARWGGLADGEKATGVAELQEVADDRSDLVAEVAGLALGTAEGMGQEYHVRWQAIAELCRMAGADESLIPRWRQIGRERAEMAGRPPFSQPRRPPARRS